MPMGRKQPKQKSMFMAVGELPRSGGHKFYSALNKLLREGDFDRKVEALCEPYYRKPGRGGQTSVVPGVYFRMLLVGYFEGIESERGLEWRCSDSLSLREFLGLEMHERVPDHSTLSRARARYPDEVYEKVNDLVFRMVVQAGLFKGKVLGVDSTYLRADASMKSIVRKDGGDGWNDYLRKLAAAEGIENPSDEDLRRMDRKRKGKKVSNEDWESKTDPDARIGRLKDGRTRMSYKAEVVTDLETGAIAGGELFTSTVADTQSVEHSLDEVAKRVERARKDDDDDDAEAPSDGPESGSPRGSESAPTTVVADKGYHSNAVLLSLTESGYRTCIPSRKQRGKRRWANKKDGQKLKKAFHNNEKRCRRKKGKALQRRRGELVERPMAHLFETGGMRRLRLRGLENARKRFLLQIAAANLGLIMRAKYGFGTPRGLAAARAALAALYERVVRAVAWISGPPTVLRSSLNGVAA